MTGFDRSTWATDAKTVQREIAQMVASHAQTAERRNWLHNAISEGERLRTLALEAGEPVGIVRGLERSIAHAWRVF